MFTLAEYVMGRTLWFGGPGSGRHPELNSMGNILERAKFKKQGSLNQRVSTYSRRSSGKGIHFIRVNPDRTWSHTKANFSSGRTQETLIKSGLGGRSLGRHLDKLGEQ